MTRRWKAEIGSRSRRAPEAAVTARSLLPRKQGQTAFRQSVNGKAAVLIERILPGAEKKVFAAAHGGRVEAQDALDEGASFGRKAISRTDLRDQTNLLRATRVDRITEQNEGKGEAGKRVFTEIGKDGDGRETGTHLGESEGGVLGHKRKVAQDRETEAEAEGVALNLSDADQGRGAQGGFELEDASRFATNGHRSAGGSLASQAENVAAGSNAQNAGAGF